MMKHNHQPESPLISGGGTNGEGSGRPAFEFQIIDKPTHMKNIKRVKFAQDDSVISNHDK